MFWGFSEALDLYNEYKKLILSGTENVAANSTTAEVNILLYGSGDPRHILKTIAKSYAHGEKIKVNFFVLEGCPELIARHLLLLNVALEPSEEFSLIRKTHLFMDIYGNSLLRPSSYSYQCSKVDHFINVITNADYGREKMQIIDFSHLKYREKDNLEDIFKFWLPKSGNVFDIKKYWEHRVRAALGTRYDSRLGAFDWDLQMKLKDYGAHQICSQEYKYWRDCGIAFLFPEYEQTVPNRTLTTGLRRNGDVYQHHGYLADISVGPFTTFGLNCDDKRMLQSDHGTNKYRATDITERNLLEILYEIQEKQPYCHSSKDSHQYGDTLIQLTKSMETTNIRHLNSNELKNYDQPLMTLDNFTITFLSTTDVVKLSKYPKFQQFFDIAFVAQNYFPLLNQEFRAVLKPISLILFETKQNSVLRKEEIAESINKIKEYAKINNFKMLTNFNFNVPVSIVKCGNFASE